MQHYAYKNNIIHEDYSIYAYIAYKKELGSDQGIVLCYKEHFLHINQEPESNQQSMRQF